MGTQLEGVLIVQRLGSQTFNQLVANSTPGRAVIKSPRSTQPFVPLGW